MAASARFERDAGSVTGSAAIEDNGVDVGLASRLVGNGGGGRKEGANI